MLVWGALGDGKNEALDGRGAQSEESNLRLVAPTPMGMSSEIGLIPFCPRLQSGYEHGNPGTDEDLRVAAGGEARRGG
jgi:hypothetical protein